MIMVKILTHLILFLALPLSSLAHADVPGLNMCIDNNGPYDCPGGGGGRSGGYGGGSGGSGGSGGGDIDVTYDDGFGRPPRYFGRDTCVDTGKHDDCLTSDEQWKNSDLGKGFRQLGRNIQDGWDAIRGVGSRKNRERRKFQRQMREVANLYDRAQHLESRINELHEETYRDVQALALESYPTREQVRERLNDIARDYNSSLASATAHLPNIDGQVEQNPSLNPESVYTKVGRQYNTYAKRVIAEQDGPRRKEQEALTLFADASFDSADGYYSDGQLSQGDASMSLGLAAVDMALSMTPGVGWGKDIYEAVSGKNLVTGELLGTRDRVFAVIGAVTAGIGSKATIGYKGAMAGITALDKIHDAGKAAEGLSDATKATSRILERANRVGPIKTPYGDAVQEISEKAVKAREKVDTGSTLYRIGKRGSSETGLRAQFWALEHPSSPGYGGRYGIPQKHLDGTDFLETATLKSDSPFVTRTAPPSPDGMNPGGGIEIVVPNDSVKINGHTSFSFGD